MTYLDAAYTVLLSAKKPLHYSEITQLALEQNLIVPTGLTPEATMGSRLYTDTQEDGSRFVRAGRGMFDLAKMRQGGIEDQIQAINRHTRDRLGRFGAATNLRKSVSQQCGWRTPRRRFVHLRVKRDYKKSRIFLRSGDEPFLSVPGRGTIDRAPPVAKRLSQLFPQTFTIFSHAVAILRITASCDGLRASETRRLQDDCATLWSDLVGRDVCHVRE